MKGAYYFVVNPRSGGGATGRRWPRLAKALGRRLGAIEAAITTEPLEATALTAAALQADPSLCVVAVGGDGTVNEVVNGFFLADGDSPPSSASLGVIPCGTGGDFGRTYGFPSGWEAAIDRLTQAGLERTIDLGQVRFRANSGATELRRFANVSSLGVSGEIVREVNAGGKGLGGKLGFAYASLRALRRYRDRRLLLSVDGSAPEPILVTVLAAANGRFFGGGMCVAPAADPSDGWLDVTIWSGYRPLDFVLKAPALYGGSHTHLAGTRTLRCRKLTVLPDPIDPGPVLLELDGEQPGTAPCEIELLPQAIRLKGGQTPRPKGRKDAGCRRRGWLGT